ncbi:uncharacterized protein Bfra_005361 [Botrytis fragariae]|uniref:Uncharacterized protein n=1 Tax=Botrytis fragariae TaxID=1964551 RepID=A0A8H6AUI4_9HELO|nr:uncharacterized protein Bfra_005361 [Botrytis fragariae]KAF5873894.1 hypothetical protein Bfra_005361 [Botrytis fragariae]
MYQGRYVEQRRKQTRWVINPFLSNDVTKPLSSSPSKENGGWSPMPIAGTININIMDSWNPLH